MKIKLKLYEARKAKGFTQTMLALEINVSRIAVQKWESGVCFPDLPHLIALTDALGCTVENLVERS